MGSTKIKGKHPLSIEGLVERVRNWSARRAEKARAHQRRVETKIQAEKESMKEEYEFLRKKFHQDLWNHKHERGVD